MSAPNKSYDPVAVSALSAKEVQRAVDEALAAIASSKDLDQLKAARLAHAGDRAPITEANAEIKALPPAARADAGRRVGARAQAVLMSVWRTCWQRGQNAVTFLSQLLRRCRPALVSRRG
jgi:phenylalanyl-tRNA synthetase alpha chain